MPRKSKSGKTKASGVAKKANGNGSGKAAVQSPQMPAAPQLVRKSPDGEISGRPRGRPAPGFENGYMQDGKFHAGNPPGMKKKAGRPYGSKNILKSLFGPSGKLRGRRAASGSSLNDIDKIVANVVSDRLKVAKEAAFKALQKNHEDAFKAFSEALGV